MRRDRDGEEGGRERGKQLEGPGRRHDHPVRRAQAEGDLTAVDGGTSLFFCSRLKPRGQGGVVVVVVVHCCCCRWC